MISTGVTRLDNLLGAGLPADAAALVYGPVFMGKETLARRTIVASVCKGIPAIVITTNATAEAVQHELAAIDPKLPDLAKGLLHYVDTYSVPVGAGEDLPHTTYLDGAMDLNGLSVAVNRVQKDIVPKHDHHLIVLDSLSTLIANANAQTVFRFLQLFIGRTRRVGAVHLALMDAGMHSDAEVQMFKHLMTGVIHFRDNQGKPQLMVQGLGTGSAQTWVEYRFDDERFEITGSFAAGRIR